MEIRAAGIIIYRRMTKGIEYLLLQTSYNGHHWTPPKGLANEGESDQDTAFRETFEETGYRKEDLRIEPNFTKVLNYQVNNAPKIVTYWLAELYGNKPVELSTEHLHFKWVTLNDAKTLVPFENMLAVLADCEEYIKNNSKNRSQV